MKHEAQTRKYYYEQVKFPFTSALRNLISYKPLFYLTLQCVKRITRTVTWPMHTASKYLDPTLVTFVDIKFLSLLAINES